MLAWPSISCTARRSCEDCSRWLANEWRSMCGCTRSARPRRRAQARSRTPTTAGEILLPRPPTNRAFSSGRGSLFSGGKPVLERFPRLAADRHDARLRSLARDRHLALPQVEPAVVDVERDELAQAQPRGVQQLEHRRVAHQLGRALLFLPEQTLRSF